ncbi:hypothetical protein NIES4101_84910 [Calothrix sp. NIES-4101]|nr:hypothetical protein NIES4101_84910 [Calothrix sp. NIES-4101]
MTIYFYKSGDAYGCFSNFSPHGIEMEGFFWATVEHYYQAQKFVGSVDEYIIPSIHAAKTPEIAAALGRNCDRCLRPDWDIVKISVMQKAVLQKFLSHADIRAVLLTTEEEILIEDSPCDYFWGCGASRQGENHLGQILMNVRTQLRNSYLHQVTSV